MRKGSGKGLQRKSHALVTTRERYLDAEEWSFEVSSNNGQDVLGASAWQLIKFEDIRWDPRGMYSAASGQITVKKPGRYFLHAAIVTEVTDIETAGDRAMLALYKNNAHHAYLDFQEVDDPNSAKQWGLQGSVIVDASIDDVFDVRGFVDDVAQTGDNGARANYFCGFKIK